MKCPHCSSTNMINSGYRTTKLGKKTIKKCIKCSKKFTISNSFPRYRFSKKIILKAVSLYKQKKSLSQVKDYLYDNYKIKVSRYTISKWYKRFKHSLSWQYKEIKKVNKRNTFNIFNAGEHILLHMLQKTAFCVGKVAFCMQKSTTKKESDVCTPLFKITAGYSIYFLTSGGKNTIKKKLPGGITFSRLKKYAQS